MITEIQIIVSLAACVRTVGIGGVRVGCVTVMGAVPQKTLDGAHDFCHHHHYLFFNVTTWLSTCSSMQ